MLTYINDRLNEWALWQLGSTGRAVGGISPFPAYNLAGRGRGYADQAPPDTHFVLGVADEARCMEVDRCVCALEPLLRQVVEEFYLRVGTIEMMAARCACTSRTVFRRIDTAHTLILRYLNDIAAGIAVKPWSVTEAELGIQTTPLSGRPARRRTVASSARVVGSDPRPQEAQS
jgi:hypothetical protein